MKFVRLIENLLLLLSVNLAYFFTTYYQHRIDGLYSVADIVFDILFTVVITWLLLVIFAKNKTIFSEGTFRLQGDKRSILFKWFLLIILKCTFDIAVWSFGIIFVEWKYLGIGLLSGAFWLIGYVLLVPKDVAIWKSKRTAKKAKRIFSRRLCDGRG